MSTREMCDITISSQLLDLLHYTATSELSSNVWGYDLSVMLQYIDEKENGVVTKDD